MNAFNRWEHLGTFAAEHILFLTFSLPLSRGNTGWYSQLPSPSPAPHPQFLEATTLSMCIFFLNLFFGWEACGIFLPEQGSNLYPLQWKRRISTTGPPGKAFHEDFYSLIQFSSVAQSCLTLRDPMNCSTPGLPVHHQLLEFTQTHVHWVSDAIQPSHPLSSPSSPAPNPSQHQSLFQWVNSSHEVAKLLEFQQFQNCSFMFLGEAVLEDSVYIQFPLSLAL